MSFTTALSSSRPTETSRVYVVVTHVPSQRRYYLDRNYLIIEPDTPFTDESYVEFWQGWRVNAPDGLQSTRR